VREKEKEREGVKCEIYRQYKGKRQKRGRKRGKKERKREREREEK
jgi:hypothetical protein